MRERLNSSIAQVICWGLLTATILITPNWSLDPINPIKLLCLIPIAFMSFSLLITSRDQIAWRDYRLIITLASGFILWQLLVLLFSEGELFQQLFGTSGRNTGFITYFGFTLVLLASAIASESILLHKIVKFTTIVGSISITYGVIQYFGFDPFPWGNSYDAVFGFLGNPNFQSSLLGVLGSILLAQLFSAQLKIKSKLSLIFYLLCALFVIKATASQQGFLVIIIGGGTVIGLFLLRKSTRVRFGYGVFSILGLVVILFGTLNKGPLASFLFKDSVTYRGDYWRAGWKMTVEHPIFGVGMDCYGDWYRRSRNLAATLRRGPDVTSNAAHNVFLDISSYGGFPLFIIYVALMALVAISAIKVLKRQSSFNPVFAGVVGGWVAFQAQSIISINQIGLAIWGWVLSGTIIGYEINTRNKEDVETSMKKGKSASKPAQNSAGSVVALFVAFVLGVLVGMPPYVASAKYKSALETSNPAVIQQAAYIWPLDYTRMIQVSATLNENKLEAQGLKVALDATKKFPDNYAVWANLDSMKSATAEQKAKALSEMKRLDPLNPNLK